MFINRVLTIISFTLVILPNAKPGEYSGEYGFDYGYKVKEPIVFYQSVEEPLVVQENLAQKYFNLFLLSPNAVAPYSIVNERLYNIHRDSLESVSNKCPRGSFFASYNPTHTSAAFELASRYNDQTDFNNLLELSQLFKTKREVHQSVWYSSFIRAQLARMPETLSLQRPSPIHLFPTSFFPDSLISSSTPDPQECVVLDETFGQDNGIENLLWYFREDVQLNAHHWIWHLLYPGNSTGPIDRRGEFFYFFHHELIARYGAERIANGLLPQTPFNMQTNSIVEEGYNPHLRNGISTLEWAARPPFQNMAAVLNSTLWMDLYNTTIERDRVVLSIKNGFVFNGSHHLPIRTFDNINTLGELAENSDHSINRNFYGDFGYHNHGHFVLANLIGNSPNGTMGVMGDVATAMRDPIFYRWHKLVDILFLSYKILHLAPYQLSHGEHQLVLKGVGVTDIKVIPDDLQGGNVNLLRTFFNMRTFNLEGRLDFNSQAGPRPSPVNICAKHLDHEEFTYQIQIENHRSLTPMPVTVRIFMAPRFRTLKEKYRYTMEEQRIRFFTMDSFVTTLQPGSNIVNRRSIDSTVTAPWPKSLEQIRREILANITGATDCDCGYPHHLLLPKGTERGMTFDLFVMVTDGTLDQVTQPPRRPQSFDVPQCTPSHVHCGIQGGNYPDSRPMGYPFDRRIFGVPKYVKHPYTGEVVIKHLEVPFLEDYVSHIPNSATTKIVIVHQNIQLGLENYVQVQNK